MADADDIAAICKDRVGFAVRFDRVEAAVAEAFKEFNAAKPTLPLTDTNDLEVSLLIATLPVPVSVGAKAVSVGPLTVTVTVHPKGDPKEELGKFECEIPKVDARLAFGKATRLEIGLADPAKPPKAKVKQTVTANPGQIKKYFGGSQADYEDLMNTIRVTLRGVAATQLLAQIRFPDYLRCLGFGLVNPQVDFAPKHVLLLSPQITGPLAVGGKPDCPKGPDANFEVPPTGMSHQDGTNPPSFTGTVTHKPPKIPVPSAWAENTPYLIYLPELVFTGLGDAAFKPAVMGHDRGTLALVYWEWAAAAGLKSGSVKGQVDTTSIRVDITAVFDVTVSASCGVTIGCIDIQLAGAQIFGTVNPSVQIVVYHDSNTGEVTLFSQLASAAVDLRLNINSPLIPFPLDKVISVILQGVAEDVIRKQIVSILNSLRVRLFNVSALERSITNSPKLNLIRQRNNPATPTAPRSVLIAIDTQK